LLKWQTIKRKLADKYGALTALSRALGHVWKIRGNYAEGSLSKCTIVIYIVAGFKCNTQRVELVL